MNWGLVGCDTGLLVTVFLVTLASGSRKACDGGWGSERKAETSFRQVCKSFLLPLIWSPLTTKRVQTNRAEGALPDPVLIYRTSCSYFKAYVPLTDTLSSPHVLCHSSLQVGLGCSLSLPPTSPTPDSVTQPSSDPSPLAVCLSPRGSCSTQPQPLSYLHT